VCVRFCCKRDEVSIAVKDEGREFDVNKIADPTVPENTRSVHSRGIYLMRALMDEVRIEDECERASAKPAAKAAPKNSREELVSSYEIHSRASIQRGFMSAIIQAGPLEKFSQEPLPTGDSCVLVIFGASGDLTNRKLIPGLYNLACQGCMNPEFEVLGVGRTR
jgi:hypothetical protein